MNCQFVIHADDAPLKVRGNNLSAALGRGCYTAKIIGDNEAVEVCVFFRHPDQIAELAENLAVLALSFKPATATTGPQDQEVLGIDGAPPEPGLAPWPVQPVKAIESNQQESAT